MKKKLTNSYKYNMKERQTLTLNLKPAIFKGITER